MFVGAASAYVDTLMVECIYLPVCDTKTGVHWFYSFMRFPRLAPVLAKKDSVEANVH